MNESYKFVIVGGGIAGVTAARAIRERDPSGTILLVSDEDRAPYKRTKISKYLARGFDRDQFAMEAADWYSQNGVELAVGERVSSVDPARHRAVLRAGGEVEWRKLILANGSRPILPEGVKTGRSVFVVRTADDVERLRGAAGAAKRSIVVGGGVLGVEVAEQLATFGKEVVLVGRGRRLLGAHLDEESASMLEKLLRENGVELVPDSPVTSIDVGRGSGESVAVSTALGERRAELVVFCVGVRPDVEVAREAGLDTGRGVLVDSGLHTSHPDIYAAGETAEHPGGYVSYLWHAAELQGQIAGANAAGGLLLHDSPPFRLKCEVFGNYFFSMNRPISTEGISVAREHNGDRYRSLYYRDDRLCGVVMANDKERAKSYVKAVREGWGPKEMEERLPLLESAPST